MKTAMLMAVLMVAGCASNVKTFPTVATEPVILHQTDVRWVPIDAALTAHIPVPDMVVPGVTPWGEVLKREQTCAASADAANGRFDEISLIQGKPVAGHPSGH